MISSAVVDPILETDAIREAAGGLRSLRIAVVHNSNGSGSRRVLQGFARALAARGHEIDVFRFSTTEEGPWPLGGLGALQEVRCRPFSYPSHTPYVFETWRQVGRRLLHVRHLARLSWQVGRGVERGGYDVLWADACAFTHAPTVLRCATRVPTFYYCHEPPRERPEPKPG